MSSARLLLDEMLSGDIATQLRAAGFDVHAVVEDPVLVGTPDEELLVHTTSNGQCLVTANIGDFAAISIRWRAERREHSGLIYIASRSFPQNRAFVGVVVAGLRQVLESDQVPASGGETYLRRPTSP